jgi:hypothetical protein
VGYRWRAGPSADQRGAHPDADLDSGAGPGPGPGYPGPAAAGPDDTPDVPPSDNGPERRAPAPAPVPVPEPTQPPVITGYSTYQEGPLVYLSVSYTDADGDAEGFGFTGANGAQWARETNPFSSPSYGRVRPGRVDYPFDHGCDDDALYESDVAFWIYDSEGRQSERNVAHLACSGGSAI